MSSLCARSPLVHPSQAVRRPVRRVASSRIAQSATGVRRHVVLRQGALAGRRRGVVACEATARDAGDSPAAAEEVQGVRAPDVRRSLVRLAGLAVGCVVLATAAGPAMAAASSESSVLSTLLSYVLHLDKHMHWLIAHLGGWIYALLFGIVFAETGLVVTPFLPGDSLLFACGTLCAMGSLNITLVLPLLWVAAVLGDTVNYAMGKWLGAKVFTADSKIFKAAYLTKTQQFYDKYGGKTVVLARFLPIVRTFAPFVAGVSNMDYPKFVMYNVLGATIWTVLFIGVGFCFGTLPVIQNNFSLAVLGIVAVSVLPVIWEVVAARAEGKKAAPPAADGVV